MASQQGPRGRARVRWEKCADCSKSLQPDGMKYISLVQAGSGAYASIAAARGGESNDAAPAQALPDPLAVLSASILGLKQDFAHQSRIVQLLRRIK